MQASLNQRSLHVSRPSRTRGCFVHAVFHPTKRRVAAFERKRKDGNAHFVTEHLQDISLYVLGADHFLTESVAATLAVRLGYNHVSTARVLQGMHNVDNVMKLADDKGWEFVADEELNVLKGLTNQIRCSTSTLPQGAVLHRQDGLAGTTGGITVLLDDQTTSTSTPTSSYPPCEIQVVIQPPVGFNAAAPTLKQKVLRCSDAVVQQIAKLLQREDGVVEAKAGFVSGGMSGEGAVWPTAVVKV